MIRHVVMMQWQDGTSDEQVQAVLDGLGTMPDLVPGILRYEFGTDLGIREETFDLVLVADFDSVDDFDTYSSHPEHLAVIAASIRPIVDTAVRVQYSV